MNDPNAPLAPDIVDELLSAELDGELARAAEDLGLSTADARARLDATPGVADRRADLLRARDVLGAAPAEIDDLLGQRLVAKALRASDQVSAAQRTAQVHRRRVLTTSGAIAAAVLIVLGLVVVFHNGSNEQNTATNGNAADRSLVPENGSTTVPTPNAGPTADATNKAALRIDLGDVSNGATARQKVLALLPVTPQAATGGARSSSPTASYGSERLAAPTADRCRGAIGVIAPNATVVLDALGTYGGTPVGVFVVTDRAGNRNLFVMAPDCRLLNAQLLN